MYNFAVFDDVGDRSKQRFGKIKHPHKPCHLTSLLLLPSTRVHIYLYILSMIFICGFIFFRSALYTHLVHCALV